MPVLLRKFLVAATGAVLVLALAWGECVNCGATTSGKGGCCMPHGRCPSSQHKTPAAPCLKVHSSAVAPAEQTMQVQPAAVFATTEVSAVIQPLGIQPVRAELAVEYSPPDLYLRNSALLI